MVLPVSVVAAGQMLNITAVTLDDRLQIGFLAIPEAVPAHRQARALHGRGLRNLAGSDGRARRGADGCSDPGRKRASAQTTPAQGTSNHGANGFDYDWLIVGSGFGGSVSALRLAEKGYRVAVLECGRRYRDEDYAATTWNLRRFLWAPALGLRGILRLTPFKDVFIASGSAVGGGSVVYACTLYRGAPEFFVNPQWAGLEDWAAALKPHYDTAERMLGVNTVPFDSDGQKLLKQVAQALRRRGHASRARRCGIFFGEPGKTGARPVLRRQRAARAPAARAAAPAWSAAASARRTRW